MTIQESVQYLQRASFTERIQAIEMLLQSLKDEMMQREDAGNKSQPFQLRTFDLGEIDLLDREEMYAERVSLCNHI